VKIIFLGTNGWYSTLLGNTICVLIETSDSYIILDAGDGFFKLDKYIEIELPIFLFLSHLHLDHIIGLHTLNKFDYKQGIDLYCYRGTKGYLKRLLDHPYSASLDQVKTEVRIHEIKEGKHKFHSIPYECRLLLHTDPCLGYRFHIEDKVITYCTDTGFCENMNLLSKNADLLILECGYKVETQYSEWPHLNPKIAAEVAKDNNVQKLVLTHFSADLYSNKEERLEAERIAKMIFPNSIAAYDDLVIKK
jgi:ribonuclease BN (tRNA processing enzyme)